jgi:Lysozyme like domain
MRAPSFVRAVRLPWCARVGAVVLLSALTCVFWTPPTARAGSSADLCAQVGARAGFAGRGLVVAVAIGLAESSCNRLARGYNEATHGCPSGSVDRGMWQINSCYHAEVSDDCAYRAHCNATATYRISAGGTDFRPWTTYRSGRYRAYLWQARAAVDRLGET